MQREIKITRDGSATLYVPELDEYYHSMYGAIQESLHVFIQSGLKTIDKKIIQILEIGYGTGLNAILTLLNQKAEMEVHYQTLEKYPLDWNSIRAMNYSESLMLDLHMKQLFKKMHSCAWEEQIMIHDNFYLKKQCCDLLEFSSPVQFDLVYFDAFAPEVQSKLWEESIFKKLYQYMRNEGVLVTYCAKGEVRRRMQRAGFQVNRLPGPPGKREMLQAIKE